jgi:DNA-binding NtrC family response regulator
MGYAVALTDWDGDEMPQAHPLRVLVVDDDEDVCLYLKRFLTEEGFGVETLMHAPDALEFVREGRHQIILLDIRMPDMDGVTLLRKLRAIDSDVCVIVMTAYPSVESAVETMKADAFDYLHKPFELEDLRDVIHRAIREKGLVIDADERVNDLIGAKVRELRKERALTLKQLGNKTGLSVSLISQIELGKSAASVSTLHKLSAALGVTMAYLFEGV